MVHQYQLNGYNIVLDTCSGAIHVVDEVAYDIIALYPDHTADEIVTAMMEKYGAREDVTEKDLRDCIDDVEALKQAGKLYTPDTFADMAGTKGALRRCGEGAVPACGAHLQPELFLLLCQPGKIPWRPCADELRGG